MDTPRRRRHGVAVVTALVALVVGAPALVTPAAADPSPQGVAHRQEDRPHHPRPVHDHRGTAKPRPNHVSLSRPNGFQAQADPDGDLNGGVDQPGGQGGLDPTSQDGNNGSGNDADCEDDNNGVGVPGHCKDRTPAEPGTVVPEVPETQTPGTGTGTGTGTDTGTPIPDSSVVSAPLVVPPTIGATSTVVTRGTSAPTSVLPETGAGQALAALAATGLMALALGSALVGRRRRSAA
jgi:LPXTG-motif cell wall-anchored protein